ncbi:hypothetical protein ACFIQG_21580 [Comamonas odontotermitis]|uniref:hypothetical protein n=1 Tax=Comamonas odontotermitis TaxID=379895 RepID=UPI00367101F2
MTDRELLDLAAKAAGIEITWEHGQDFPERVELFRGHLANYEPWNPLTDDGDALRLAVKLRLVVHVWDDGDMVSAAKTEPNGEDPASSSNYWVAEDAHACGGIEYAARRAIVRAAAAIQQAKETPCSSTS